MRILYLSCHSVLEEQEIRLFTEMGHDVFSPSGAYMNPHAPADKKRPPIMEAQYHEHLIQVAMQFPKEALHKELVDWADAIMIMHVPGWVTLNWENIKHKPVIWRSIGQSTSFIENQLMPYREQGMKIVRYSPAEGELPINMGGDAMIRFYEDENELGNWNGNKKEVITLGQSIKQRGEFCHFELFDEATRDLPRKVYGADNSPLEDLWGGQLDYEELKQMLRDNRVFFYTGTQPASYTLGFIEAFMTGIPIVALGENTGNSMFRHDQDTYEVPNIIDNGINGFCSDDINELRGYVKQLLEDHELAKKISAEGRKTAIELFGKENIKKQWEEFFEDILR